MKMLLVDDEELVLKGFEILISTSYPEFEILSACNGEAALELMRNFKPDIIVTDVRMPVMDGLTFCEKLKENRVNSKIIIISGYEDFNYAKRAIGLGVIKYVLKPIDQDNFLSILKDAISEIEAEKKNNLQVENNLKMAKEKLLIDLIQYDMGASMVIEKVNQSRISLFSSSYFIAVMEIDDYFLISEYKGSTEFNNFYQKLEFTICNILSAKDIDIIYTENKPGEFVFLSTSDTGLEPGFLYEILNTVKSELSISITIGISGTYHLASAIYQAYQEAFLAVNKSFFKDKGAVYLYDPAHDTNLFQMLYKHSLDINYGHLGAFDKQLLSALNQRDYNVCRNNLSFLFEELSKNNYPPDFVHACSFKLYIVLSDYLLTAGSNMKKIMGERAPSFLTFSECKTLSKLKSLLSDVLESIIQYISTSEKCHTNLIINRIMQIAQEDYANITLNSAAEKVGINPTYLSILFKEKTGENFKDYILKLKAEAAKELLNDPALKIYEISEKLGYNDSKHFSKMFRKITGLTPTEYRENPYS